MEAIPDLAAMFAPFPNPRFIVFTDFDGTITLMDSNDYLSDNYGFGMQRRQEGSRDVIAGRISFRESFRKMMDSVSIPFSRCIDILMLNVKLDPGFKEFLRWALEHRIPVIILSSGMEPIIRALLERLVGPDHDKIAIISNDVQARPGKTIDQDGGWQLKFRDDSFGHDKSRAIRPYANLPEGQRPTLLYAGDGVSDLCAARETDLLFAKEGNDWCAREDVPFTSFTDWSEILTKVKEIVEGKVSVGDAALEGYRAFKDRKHSIMAVD